MFEHTQMHCGTHVLVGRNILSNSMPANHLSLRIHHLDIF